METLIDSGAIEARQVVATDETAGACIELLPDEYWWGGAVDDGVSMPFRAAQYACDLRRSIKGNQASPLLVSSRGRFLWSDDPFEFTVSPSEHGSRIYLNGARIVFGDGYGTLAGAFRAARDRFFPPHDAMPDPLVFSAPQYNSWIEMQYEPTQQKVLDYARAILENGLSPGVLIVDDNWFEDHGTWRFNRTSFPDPAAMVEELHRTGFRIMLWISPFVSPDSGTYRRLAKQNLLVSDAAGVPVVRCWWNGQSALLDITHPEASDWLRLKLSDLMERFGIDGFKFDAGDPDYMRFGDVTYANFDGIRYCEAWAEFGAPYRFNEYRACWKQGGKGLVQRLRDKRHEWGRGGIADIVPNGLAQGLAGYSFICPDMVGGGDIRSFSESDFRPDQELFVRTLQCSALFPVVQFSLAPWRVLDRLHWGYCQSAIATRMRLTPTIVALAEHAARTGEPIVRHMAYVFPGCGLERVADQFMLGNRILVAPVTLRAACSRTVVFPPGRWTGPDGKVVEGPRCVEVDAPISCLPWYIGEDLPSNEVRAGL